MSDAAPDMLPFDARPAPVPPAPVDAKGRLPSYIRDHRTRLRQRFLDGGADALPDYELLELVLFRAIPRQDVKPLARRLLDRFGSFAGVLSAHPARLGAEHGVGQAVICELKIAHAAATRLARARVMQRPVMSSWDDLIAYLRAALAHDEVESFRCLYLDRRNALVADEEAGRGTVDHVPVYPREVLKRALELNASALVLVHNHPSGDPSPSDADIETTRRIAEGCDALGLVLHDHVIVGAEAHVSLRAEGLV